MTSAFSSQPCAVRTSQPASLIPFLEPWIRVESVSGTPPGHRASCERSFDPHESSVVLGGENAVGEPLAQGGGQHATKTAAIVDRMKGTMFYADIGKRFGVGSSAISAIMNRQSWTEV